MKKLQENKISNISMSSNAPPCNNMMEDGRISDHRFPADVNFNTFNDAHQYRHYLQKNAAKIINATKDTLRTDRCSDNLPFETSVNWTVKAATYQYPLKPTIKYT